jgi:hypothetical protein
MGFKKAYVPLRERTRTAGRLLDLFAEEIRDAGAVEVAQALIDKVCWLSVCNDFLDGFA